MNFRKLVPEDQSLLNEYIQDINNFQTDYSISTLLLFLEFENIEISIDTKSIFIKGFLRGEEIFFSPLCRIEDFNESIEKIISYYKEKDKQYRILSIQKEYIKEFLKYKNIKTEEEFYENDGFIKGKEFIIFNSRADAEYIYLPKDLINLEGNKYKKIREKIRAFQEEYKRNYEFVEYNENYYHELANLLIEWNNEKNFSYIKELEKIKYVIENKEKLGINIYLLKINNNVAGMTIIQVLPNNLAVILFEKSHSKYKNANYILNLFEANQLKNCRAISRQEDLGIEGLRQIKLSYKPFCFEEKFFLFQYNEEEFFTLYKSIFEDSDKLIELIKHSDNYNVYHSSFVLKSQKIVSIGSTREKRLRIFNKIEEIPFIFGIATKKEERRKGYAGEILKRILNRVYFENCNIAMIAPAGEHLVKYYEKFGFVKFNFMKKIPIENLFKKNFDIRIGNINDSQEITKLFHNYSNKYKLSQYRDNQFTIERLKEVFVDDGKLFILSKNKIDYGYFIYQEGIIIEYINLLENEENEKIDIIKKFLEDKNLDYILDCKTIDSVYSEDIENTQNCNTYSLIRIIHPENFVKKYLDYIFFNDTEDFNKNVLIKDEILGDTAFNIKKINNKNHFSMNIDENGINIEISISNLMKYIIINFRNKFDDNYIIEDKFYFTEQW